MKKGKVFLIGAGPGDPGLITWRGREILASCDAVVYDSLAPRDLLRSAPRARKIDVGKRGGLKTAPKQSEINGLLWRLAKRGLRVARLKGGDPMIFGRGAEEALYLREKKVPFEIIPGVTAALGAAAYAGIPLTHRNYASHVTLVTAHEDPRKSKSLIDWKALARGNGTLVFYMAVRTLPQISKRLLEAGLSPASPAAVIEWASTPGQRVIDGHLGDIARKTREAGIGAPALAVVGKVLRLRNRLDWFHKGKLEGSTVLVTRARHQAGRLREALERCGARVIECPAIEILPPLDWRRVDHAIARLSSYDWVVFTSANGVESFMERLFSRGRDARAFGPARLSAIGPATAGKLEEYGLRADCVPKEFVSESLACALAKRGRLRGEKVILLRADIARPFLREELARQGADVEEVAVYRTRSRKGMRHEISRDLEAGRIDYVTFTSSSTVKSFVAMVGRRVLSKIKDRTKWVSIGPVTSKALEDEGLKVWTEARPYTIPALVEALAGSSNGSRHREGGQR
jgi:uroporphyrinogen III methyltransferase/synthase